MAMHRGYHYIKQLLIVLFLVITVQLPGQIIPGVVASSIHSSTFPTSGLIAYYKMDESSGNLIDTHSTYDGTATSLTYSQTGVINTAVSFNGTSSNVAVGTASALRPTTGLSYSFWIKASTQSAEKLMICNTAWSTNWYGWRMSLTTGGSIEALMCNGTDAQMLDIVDGADALDDNAWHHIVLTWNGSTVYTYHDNNKSAGTAWAYTLAYISACNLHFGSNEEGNASFYAGLIDELAIYNRALTDAEVQILFDETPY